MKKLHRKRTVHPSPPTISDQLSFLPATILTLTVALSPEDREVLAYLISCSSSSSSNGGNPRRTTKGGGVVNVVDGDHPPLFHCSCFRCYMSYWVRWDSSPNHQLIHEIIDAFEDSLAAQTNNKKVKRNKRGSNNNNKKKSPELKRSELALSSPRNSSVPAELGSVGESSNSSSSNNNSSGGVGEGGDGVEDEEKGSNNNNNNNNNKSPELKRSEFALSSPPNSSLSAELESVGESSSSSSNNCSGGVGEGGDGVKDEEKGSVRRFVSFIGERIWGAWGQ